MRDQEYADADLVSVLQHDGIPKVDTHDSINQTINRLDETKQRMGAPPWSVRVVYNESMSGVLICQNPGEGNRWHYHPDSDEWWVMLEGELQWGIEGVGEVVAKPGDIVFVPRKRKHIMRCVGSGPCIRLSIGVPDVTHIYVPSDTA